MKSTRYNILGVFLLFLSVSSCVKKEDVVTNTPSGSSNNSNPTTTKGPYSDLETLFKEFAPVTKEASFDVSQGFEVVGNGGIHYIFPADAFISGANLNVTGTVTAKLTDYISKADMIYAGVVPMSDSQAIESGGLAQVDILQNGQKVFLKMGSYFDAVIPQDSTPVPLMELFRGKWSTIQPAKANWKRVPYDPLSSGYVVYPGGDSIKLFSDSLGYVGCNKFLTDQRMLSGAVNLVGVPIGTLTDKRAYFLVDGIKAVTYLPIKSENTVSITGMPKRPGHVVVMAIVNGNFYAGIQATIPADGMFYNLKMEKVIPADFKTQLKALK